MFNMTTREPDKTQLRDVRIGVRISTALHNQLMKHAIRQRKPLSAAVRELLQKSLVS
jgi:hypothetical protein